MTPVDEYINVCGIAPICIIKLDGGCFGFVTGRGNINHPHVVNVHWAGSSSLARVIARDARRGKMFGDKGSAELGLQIAASAHGASLTPNLIVMSRATIAAKTLQTYIDAANKRGALASFNRQYKLRRMAATARGDGYMSYNTALLRLRRAIIALLIERRSLREIESMFDAVL